MARFDLNLLSALNALLSDRNVTRAAERLNVTQPTMSGMLQRLRYQFDDQLLVRNGRELELTPFGASLVEPVREALRSVEFVINTEPVFVPATSNREFTLMASDYCTSTLLAQVLANVATQAPGVRVVILPIDAPIERLFSGETDLCITADDFSLFGFDNTVERIVSEHLFSDELVCVVAEDHPLNENSDLEELLSYPHVGVQLHGTVNTIETASLQRHLPMYKPNFVVADFALVASVVALSQAVGVIQARMADVIARAIPIRTFRPPFIMPTLKETMMWHKRHIQDPAHVWLRGIIRDAASEWLCEGSAGPVAEVQPIPKRQRRPATIHPIR